MSFDKINQINENLSEAVKKEYLQAAFVLPFSGLEIQQAFSEAEIGNVNKFVNEMKAAADDNTKKAEAITRYAGVVTKLLVLAGVPV